MSSTEVYESTTHISFYQGIIEKERKTCICANHTNKLKELELRMSNIRERKTKRYDNQFQRQSLPRTNYDKLMSSSMTQFGGRKKENSRRVLWITSMLTFVGFVYFVRVNLKLSLIRSKSDEKVGKADSGIVSDMNSSASRRISDHVDFHLNYDMVRCLQNKDKSGRCRLDTLGEFLEEEGAAFIHAPLKSIPLKRRIPRSMANNDTFIEEQRNTSPSNGTATALVEYNPTLIALYENTENGLVSPFETKMLDYITGRYLDDISDEEADRVMYISVQRSTNHHACGVQLKKKHETIAEQCFVAIALLDKDLQAIPGAELVVDLDYYMINFHVPLEDRFHSDFGAYNCQMNDVTITAQRSSKTNPLKDQLFLLFSGQAHSNMIPIDLRRILHSTDSGDGWDTKINNAPLPATRLADEEALYGEGLQIRFLDALVRTNARPLKTSAKKTLQQTAFLDWRKNYHFLEATDGSTWFELTPLRNHETRPINFFHDKFETVEDLNYFPNTTTFLAAPRSGSIRRTHEGQTTSSWYHDEPLYDSVSLKRSDIQLPGVKFRGTACCADMNYRGEQVKVGITHTVSKERSYLYAFYAFKPSPPFEIVALSGYFCFGGMKSSDIGYEDHWMSERLIDPESDLARLDVMGETYNCPKVAFASGINEMVDSRDNIIISYGVGDCYSRSIVVPKQKIQILLSGL